jgi:ATP-dependent DNA ligase
MEEIVKECRNTNSPIKKQAILKDYAEKYPALKDLLFRAYEPFDMYHMQAKVPLNDFGQRGAAEMWEEFSALLDIMTVSPTPQKNKEILVGFLEKCNQDTQTLFLGVVRKNLKLGFGIKQINKVFPNLITEFDVMLAQQFKTDKNYPVKMWKASSKLDGIRLVSLFGFPNKGWHIFTRKGKDITSRVPHLVQDLEAFHSKWGFTFLDGEGYTQGIPFEQLQGDILRHGGKTCSYVNYHVFAFGDINSFLNGSQKGMVIPSRDPISCGNIRTVPNFDIPNDPDRMIAFALKMEAQGFEGGIFRNPDVPYPKGRTNHMLKLKTWLLDTSQTDISVECVSIEGSLQTRLDKASDTMIEVYTLKSISFRDHKDIVVTKAGSGFTHAQRDEFWGKKNELIGKMFDIKFQKTGSRGGKIFPVFQRWRFDL